MRCGIDGLLNFCTAAQRNAQKLDSATQLPEIKANQSAEALS